MSRPHDDWTNAVMPLPEDAAIRAVLGESYDPDTALNVIEMFAAPRTWAPPSSAW